MPQKYNNGRPYAAIGKHEPKESRPACTLPICKGDQCRSRCKVTDWLGRRPGMFRFVAIRLLERFPNDGKEDSLQAVE